MFHQIRFANVKCILSNFFKASAFGFKGKMTLKTVQGLALRSGGKAGSQRLFPEAEGREAAPGRRWSPWSRILSVDHSYPTAGAWGLSAMAHQSRCPSGWGPPETTKGREDGCRKGGEDEGSRTKGRNIPPHPGLALTPENLPICCWISLQPPCRWHMRSGTARSKLRAAPARLDNLTLMEVNTRGLWSHQRSVPGPNSAHSCSLQSLFSRLRGRGRPGQAGVLGQEAPRRCVSARDRKRRLTFLGFPAALERLKKSRTQGIVGKQPGAAGCPESSTPPVSPHLPQEPADLLCGEKEALADLPSRASGLLPAVLGRWVPASQLSCAGECCMKSLVAFTSSQTSDVAKTICCCCFLLDPDFELNVESPTQDDHKREQMSGWWWLTRVLSFKSWYLVKL